MATVADDILAPDQYITDRTRHGHSLVGREVAGVMQIGLPDDPVCCRIRELVPGWRVEHFEAFARVCGTVRACLSAEQGFCVVTWAIDKKSDIWGLDKRCRQGLLQRRSSSPAARLT